MDKKPTTEDSSSDARLNESGSRVAPDHTGGDAIPKTYIYSYYTPSEAYAINKLLQWLVAHPTSIKVIFKSLKMVEYDRLAASLVNLIFWHHQEEELMLPLVKFVLHDEFSTNRTETVMRENSFSSKLLKAYLNFVGDDYLYDLLGAYLEKMIGDKKTSFEIDPSKVKQKEIIPNQNKLERNATALFQSIISQESIDKLPLGIRAIAQCVASEAKQYIPDQIHVMIGSFVFLRYINPSLFTPERMKKLPFKKEISATSRRNLILVTKMLQNLSNQKSFGGKEDFMKPMDRFIEANQDALAKYFDTLISFKLNPQRIHDDRYKVDVSDQDQQLFHFIVDKYHKAAVAGVPKAEVDEFMRWLAVLGPYDERGWIASFNDEELAFVKSVTPLFVIATPLTIGESQYYEAPEGIKGLGIISPKSVIFAAVGRGKLLEFHFLDITHLTTVGSNTLQIAAATKNINFVFEKDDLLKSFVQGLQSAYSTTFHIPVANQLYINKIENIKPPKVHLVGDFPLPSLYRALCDYYYCTVSDQVIWDLEHMFLNNRTLSLHRWLDAEFPISDKELQAVFRMFSFSSHFNRLHIHGAKLDKPSFAALTTAMFQNTSVQELIISDLTWVPKIGPTNFAPIFSLMSTNTNLPLCSIDLSNSPMDLMDFSQLGAYLGVTKNNMVKLNLSQHTQQLMKEEGVKKIVSAIVENPTRWNHLTFLSLNNLVMTGLEPALAKALDVLVHLETLELAGTQILINQLFGVLAPTSLSFLQKLNLSRQHLQHSFKDTESGQLCLVAWLNRSPGVLQELNLSSTDVSIDYLLQILAITNPNLTLAVNFSHNEIGVRGGAAIGAAAAAGRVHCTELNLSDCNLGDDGLQKLLEGLFHNSSLRTLNIKNNFRLVARGDREKARAELIDLFLTLLKAETSNLSSLLMGTTLGKVTMLEEFLHPILNALRANTRITTLDISGHNIGDHGILVLAQMLEVNKTITKIVIDDNNTGVCGFIQLHASLQGNVSLVNFPTPLNDVTRLMASGSPQVSTVQAALAGITKCLTNNRNLNFIREDDFV